MLLLSSAALKGGTPSTILVQGLDYLIPSPMPPLLLNLVSNVRTLYTGPFKTLTELNRG